MKAAGVGFVAVLAMQACGGSTAVQTSPAPARTAEETARLAELEELYRARADSARMRYNEADVRFMTGMIGHHAQALVMSGLAPSRDASPSVQTLTARTINAQNDEIAAMRGWLEARGLSVPEIHISGTDLTVRGPMGEMDPMPGMLTAAQMSELAEARGSDFDRLFLMYMIQHHAGAVTMVEELFATDGAALGNEVFKIASDIQVDQTTEINRMERMLEALPTPGRQP